MSRAVSNLDGSLTDERGVTRQPAKKNAAGLGGEKSPAALGVKARASAEGPMNLLLIFHFTIIVSC